MLVIMVAITTAIVLIWKRVVGFFDGGALLVADEGIFGVLELRGGICVRGYLFLLLSGFIVFHLFI